MVELFNVRSVDRGRPLADLTHRLRAADLTSDAARVLDTLAPIEREMEDDRGGWYLTRLLPYRSAEDRIEGVVVTFVDITSRKQAEEELRQSKTYAESIVETLHEPLLVLAPDLRVQSANRAFYRHFRVKEDGTMGRLVYDLGNGQWDTPELRTLLEDVLPRNNVFNDYEVRHEFEGLGERVMLLNARRLHDVRLILVGIRDVTESKRAEEYLRLLKENLEETVVERTRQVRELSRTLSLVEQEVRHHVSHLLHDDLQQLLYGTQTRLATARRQADRGDTDALLAGVDRCMGLLEDAVNKTRQLSVDLSPPVLRGGGLVEALQWLESQMRDLHGLAVTVRAEKEAEPPSTGLTVLIFAAVRELLFNVAKHADTDRAEVLVESEGDDLTLTVRDDGSGFDPSVLEEGNGLLGLGLGSVRERLRLQGGDLEIHSRPGEGTRVVIYVPLRPASSAFGPDTRPSEK